MNGERTNKERQDHQRELIAGEAADWFARLHDESRSTATDQDEFARWVLRSPVHVEEYLATTRLWGDMASVGQIDLDALIRQAGAETSPANVVVLDNTGAGAAVSRAAGTRGTGRSRRVLAYAAAVLLTVVMVGGGLMVPQWLDAGRLSTAVGEQRSLALPDGSMVYLNTDSRLRVAFSGAQRRLVLERGEARFRVARDARRPFVVVTPQTTVRAVGTQFNVQILQRRTAVTVIEGRVALADRDARSVELAAGEQAAVTDAGQVLPGTGPGVEQVLAWAQRRLIFHEEPLSVVIEEFNRYHVHPLHIDDPSLAAMKISGAFDAGDPDSLVQYLQRYEQVEVTAVSGRGKRLSRMIEK
jgi:transmembrane sensor